MGPAIGDETTGDHAMTSPPEGSGPGVRSDAAHSPAPHTRRTMIRSAGVAGTVAVIGSSALTSACSSEESGDSGGSDGPAADAQVPTADVPVGSGTVVDETYVVTQPKEGEFFAFSSVCTHQGCQVRTVTEDTITCPCHSSQFSTTTGEVVAGPAEEPLAEYEVAESGGTLTISAGA